jgi:hypothetical protein
MCNNVFMTDYSEFAPTDIASKGLNDESKALMDEGMSETDALRSAATTMDGAGDNPHGTVESMQTCLDLEGNPVNGLTSNDVPMKRNDEFADNEEKRHEAADAGKDEAAEWLRKNDPNYFKDLDEKLVKKHLDK